MVRAVSSTADARRGTPALTAGEPGRLRTPRPWAAPIPRPAARILLAGGLTLAGWLLSAALSHGTASAGELTPCPARPDTAAVTHAAQPGKIHFKNHHATCDRESASTGTDQPGNGSTTSESDSAKDQTDADESAAKPSTAQQDTAPASSTQAAAKESATNSAADQTAIEQSAGATAGSATEQTTTAVTGGQPATDPSATDGAATAPGATEQSTTAPTTAAPTATGSTTTEPATTAPASEPTAKQTTGRTLSKTTSTSGGLLNGLLGGPQTGGSTPASSGGGLVGGLLGGIVNVVGQTLDTVTTTLAGTVNTLGQTVLAPLTQPCGGGSGAPVLLPIGDVLGPVFGGGSNSGGVTVTVPVTAVAPAAAAAVTAVPVAAEPVVTAVSPQVAERVVTVHPVTPAKSAPATAEQPRDSGVHAREGGGGDSGPGLPAGGSSPAALASGVSCGHGGPGGARHPFAVPTDDVTLTQLRLIGTSRGHDADGAGREAALPTTSPD